MAISAIKGIYKNGKIKPYTKLIVALDINNKKKALSFVDKLKDKVNIFKVGSELFTLEGPDIIKSIIKKGCKVFLDLKYHDIPNTVARVSNVATELGVFMFNVHSSGGSEMMKATVEAVEKKSRELKIKKPIVIAVTMLTSIDDRILSKDLGVNRKVHDQVIHLAKLSKQCGMDGVVASSLEITSIRKACGRDFVMVIPGIRPLWASKNEQKRVNTPASASNLGADYIVVGRPILDAENPVNAVKQILTEMRGDVKK